MRAIEKFKKVVAGGSKRQNGTVLAGSGGVYQVRTDGGAVLRVDGDGDYRSGQRVVVLGNRIVGTVTGGLSVRSERG